MIPARTSERSITTEDNVSTLALVATEVKDSILNSTKKILGLDAEYDAFDLDVLTHINSAFMTLNQLAVGPPEGFQIEGPDDTWDTFLGDDLGLNMVKSYIYLRVRLLFDLPTNSFTITAMKEQATEMEWRLNVYAENTPYVAPVLIP